MLSLGAVPNEKFPGVRYEHIAITDFPTENITGFLPTIIEFIDQGLHENSGVLVHCAAGQSRSAAAIIAWLIKRQNLTFQAAFALLKSKRLCACPNLGFQEQLILFSKSLGHDELEAK